MATLNRIRAVPVERRATARLGDIACPLDQLPTATSDESVLTLLQRMTDCADGRAAVLDDGGRVIGVVSPTDINRTVLMHDLRPFDPYQRAHGADLTTWVGSGSGRR
jgi:CBS-domain-containing membrane protein